MSLTALFVYAALISCWVGGLVRPILGVMGYLIVYMVYNPYSWWVVSSQYQLPRPSLVAMFFVVAGALLHAREFNWTISRKEFEFYLFLGLCWLSTFVFGTIVEAYNWQYVMKMTKIFVFIFFFIRIVSSLENYKLIVWTFIICAIFLSYQAHLPAGSGRLDRIGGIDFGEANGLAAFMATSVFFLGFKMIRFSKNRKLIFIITIAAIAFIVDTIILTESRAIFLGFLFSAFYVYLKVPQKIKKHVLAFGMLGVMLFFMLSDTSFINRMQTIKEHINFNQVFILDIEAPPDRFDFWKTSIRIFKDHPLGIGVKNFPTIVQLYDEKNPGMDAHNTYVLCFSEIGILGIILFLIIIMETVMQLRRIHLSIKNTVYEDEISLDLISIEAILILFFTGYMMTHSNLYTETLWILLALPICLENATQKLLLQNERSVQSS